MRLCPLFSGSSGNSTYIGIDENNGLLVDVGKSAKQIERALNENNISIKSIKAIFVTHEHIDHVAGLKVFAKKNNLKIYGSEGTIGELISKGIINNTHDVSCVSECSEIDLEFVHAHTLKISHDCKQGMGFVFTSRNGVKVAVCTDLGYVSNDIKEAVSECDTVLMESNHDVMMLQNGPYPYYLKRRILSDIGHLSNDTCSELLPYFVNRKTKNIILSHLSEKNNIPELARQTAIYNLEKYSMKENFDFNLYVSPKSNDGTLSINF